MTEFFQVSALLAVLCNTVVAVLILWRGQRRAVNRAYFLWASAMVMWNLGSFFTFQSPEEATGPDEARRALFWVHFVQFGVIMIPITNLHLTLLVAQVSWRRLLWVLYALYGCLIVSLFSGYFVSGVHYIGYKWYAVSGPAFPAYIVLFLVTTTIIMSLLFVKQRTLSPLHRTRLRALMLAFSILLVFGGNDLLPILGCLRYPVLGVRVYPLGLTAATVYSVIVGYSLLQHQILDVHLKLSRLASYLVQWFFNLFCGFALLCLLMRVYPKQMRGGVFLGSMAVIMLNSLITSLFFPRFFGQGRDELERRILGDRFSYHDDLRRYMQKIRARPNPDSVVQELHALFTASVGMKSFQIIMRDETTQSFNLVHSCPERVPGPVPELTEDAPLSRYFRGSHPGYLAFKIGYAMPGETELERAARKQLLQFDSKFCFPLFWENQVYGYLLIGPKINEDPYTPQDLRLLVELVQDLGLLLNQTRLKSQIMAAQEQELLGRMSRGLAHDLNNLITPAQTFLQLCAQGVMNQEAMNELLPVALRNVEAVRSYINDALFFSRTHRLEVKPCRIDETIRNAVELMDARARRKGIEFRLEGLSPVVAEVDGVMIQRLLGNLISNAVDASPPQSAIQIQLARLPRTAASRDWIRVRVLDSGVGISRENLERVVQPYFTTKDRGDGQRGFGLGLAIARRIVHLHGGNLRITSVENRGTTVDVDLPGRHHALAAEPKPLTAADVVYR